MVIAYKAGGALDIVNEDTGVFFAKQSLISLKKALRSFSINNYKSKDIVTYSEQFSATKFHQNIKATIGDIVDRL